MKSALLVATALVAAIFASTAPLGCDVAARPLADTTYRDDAAAILDAKCASCHSGDTPAAGLRLDSYRGALGCTESGRVAVLPSDAAPLLSALDRPDHQPFVTPSERDTLSRWIFAGSQSVHAGVHPPGFADPRSKTGHATLLRDRQYRPLTRQDDANYCATCHEGAGARPSKVTTAAPGATACTSCHAESGGVNACATCHGSPGKAYPPRDACFFGGDSKKDAHASHAAPSRSRASGLDCVACHPSAPPGGLGGTHGDGYVEVWFNGGPASFVGREPKFDAASKRCSGTCHDRGGTTPTPTWSAPGSALDCNACHASPPKAHYAGPCSSCHREANAGGTELAAPRLHINGKVDLGDGSGRCGACHGVGDSPWPLTGAHTAHASPSGAAPVRCDTCHVVPGANERHPLGRGGAAVRLAGLATKGGSPATYDPQTKACAATYCHGGSGGTKTAPRWDDGPSASTCNACHATPPPPPHAQATSCGTASCHEGITTGELALSSAGRAVHVNGTVDRRAP